MPITSPDAHLVLNCTPQLTCTTAPDGTILFLNTRWFEFTGRPASNIVDKDLESFWIACVHPGDRDTVYEQWATGVHIGKPFEGRYRILGQDGEYHWFHSNAIPMHRADNGTATTLVGWVCTSTNIQPQIDAEARFSRLIETSFVGLCISNPDSTITYMNPSLLKLLGYEKSDVDSGTMRWKDLTPPEFAAAATWANQHVYLTGDALAAAITADNLPWDPSILALLPFPTVLDMMARDPQWTGNLGNAVLNQRQDVMDAVQRLRRQAHDYGYLNTNTNIDVVDTGGYIQIQPYNPYLYYVPIYDPIIVFGPPRPGFYIAGAIRFGPVITIGPSFGRFGWFGAGFGWSSHAILIDHRPWTRTYVNRGAYVHPYARPYVHPSAPRVEQHAPPQSHGHR